MKVYQKQEVATYKSFVIIFTIIVLSIATLEHDLKGMPTKESLYLLTNYEIYVNYITFFLIFQHLLD